MKRVLLLAFFLITGVMAVFSQQSADVVGYWFMHDSNTGDKTGIIYVYEYKDKIYGRLFVAFDPETGDAFSYVDEADDRVKHLIGEPRALGLDMLWGLEWDEVSGRFVNGNVMDPRRKGRFGAELWRVGDTLNMRGSLGPFGSTVVWSRAYVSDLPVGVPSLKSVELVPVIYYDGRGRLVEPFHP